jgi:hypothetical protein
LQGDIRSGTPAYMSPEQLAGTEVTIRSDIYSLGLLLYELFTGKRAFQAASLMELMEMQERAEPASITTLVKDLDPAVERVIQRCLQPDPRQRPASALAVAAALPGGDPLAAALAAGETPSPELVAAAGETEGLPPKVAVPWLAAALVGIIVVAVLVPSQAVTTKLPLENSPEGLTRDARTIIRSFGYTARPGDAAWALQYDDDYRNYLKRHPKEAAARWKDPAAGQPPLVAFWYRESPRPMAAAWHFNVAVTYEDPPFEMSGMVRLRTDADGKLREFEAVPPQVEAAVAPSGAFDWARLFQAAGLDQSQFQPADPQWTPLANWDMRAAWTGADPRTGAKLRVEAAAWRGRPVSFRIIGAARMSAWYFACGAASLFLNMHHSATALEVSGLWRVAAAASVNAVVVWVFYLALEPWVRRGGRNTGCDGDGPARRRAVIPVSECSLRHAARNRRDAERGSGRPLIQHDFLFHAVSFAGAAAEAMDRRHGVRRYHVGHPRHRVTHPLGGYSRERAPVWRACICAPAVRTASVHCRVYVPGLAERVPADAGPLGVVHRADADPAAGSGVDRGLRVPHIACGETAI